jgi:hypothetical protein
MESNSERRKWLREGFTSLIFIPLLLHTESESYVTTDGQPASLSWTKHPSGAYDQILITVR